MDCTSLWKSLEDLSRGSIVNILSVVTTLTCRFLNGCNFSKRAQLKIPRPYLQKSEYDTYTSEPNRLTHGNRTEDLGIRYPEWGFPRDESLTKLRVPGLSNGRNVIGLYSITEVSSRPTMGEDLHQQVGNRDPKSHFEDLEDIMDVQKAA